MKKAADLRRLGIRELAGYLCGHLRQNGLDAVLVGGACVSIYSSAEYESFDLDFVSFEEGRRIVEALKEIGFHQTTGRHFGHPQTRYYAEFLNPPVAVGQQQLTKFRRMRTPLGTIKMLTPTDCVKDRLAAYLHWKDRQALQQAAMVASAQTISWSALHQWAGREGSLAVLGDLKAAVSARNERDN